MLFKQVLTQIDVDAKCLKQVLKLQKLLHDAGDSYDVTIVRNGGDDVLGGVKLVFTAADGTANVVVDVPVTGCKSFSCFRS